MNDTQKLLLDAFSKLISYFDKEHIAWWVDGGTLLGAIREHGFIEWDDDIDIMMPRESYDKLCSLVHEHPSVIEGCFFQDPFTDRDYFNLHLRLRIDNTCCISKRERNLDSHKGIFIDIYPLDCIPVCYIDEIASTIRALCKNTDVEEDKSHYFKQMQPIYAYDVIHELLRCKNNKISSYAFPAIFWRFSKYKGMKFYSTVFDEMMQVDFESLKVNVPLHYDAILREWYGPDWMTPRKEKSLHES